MSMRLLSRPAKAVPRRKYLLLLDPFAEVKSRTSRVILRLLWRIALLVVLALIVTSCALVSSRLTTLWGLPDAREPFDTADFRPPEVPAERDAFAIYPVAAARFKPFANHGDWFGPPGALGQDWQSANKDVQSWLVQNREALDLWRQAADRPETSVRQPDGPDLLSGPSGAPFYALFRLGQLEASRQETEGNLDGAWAWHRACLRMIRHVQDYDPLRRAADFQQLFSSVAAGVRHWAGDPRVGASLLRTGLDDAQALDIPTTRGSAALKLEYLSIVRNLSDPPSELVEQAWSDLCSDGDDMLWYRHVSLFHESRWFVRNEPERSRRVARLVFTHWIANCDVPSSLWPNQSTWTPIGNGGFPLLLLSIPGSSGAPAAPEGLTAVELSKWHDSTLLFRRLFNNDTCYKLASYQSYVIKRRADQASLIVSLAEELYAKEHGGQYPSSPQDLVGRYLKRLPEDDLDSAGKGQRAVTQRK
jgi:hypothetical protein